MNNQYRFAVALGVFWLLIALQFGDAWLRGWATHAQMRRRHGLGEHGGLIVDIPLSLLFAYLVAKYHFFWFSDWSMGILGGWYVAWNILTFVVFVPAGRTKPEAHTANGKVFLAMHVHNVYAALLSLIATMVFLPGFSTPEVSKGDIWFMAIFLCVWAFFGVRKFNPHWNFDTATKQQVGAEIALLLALAVGRTIL
ncbi:MAG: hypothetical protein B7X04_03195 [Parcubacteria group bacterium 21-54-25]|nr:MAG: hypothetical protein B7X04_03195 [Parcubacteria group bacterium 21-54-25]